MSGFNPQIFKWARDSAGLTLDDAADAAKIKAETLAAIEAGDEAPSRSQLLRMAKAYRRSLLTFYLPSPPKKGDRGEDFRTVTQDRTMHAEADLDAMLRDIRARQSVVRSILEDDEDNAPVAFVGSAGMAQGVEAVAKSIEGTLGIDREEFRKQRTTELAFSLLRAKVEAAGVFVMLVGNLGSHHSAIPVEAFRGFAIADPLAPFIVINDQDAKTAWSFTLLHELAHLWLGATGVSGPRSEQRIEQFCNAVAGAILTPASDLAKIKLDADGVDERIAVIAKHAAQWRVSRQMVAYGLLNSGAISRAEWLVIDSKLREMWAGERRLEREANKGRDSGPSYYVVRRHRLGHAMLSFTQRAMSAGTLSPVKAAQVLGVRPRSVYHLLRAISQ